MNNSESTSEAFNLAHPIRHGARCFLLGVGEVRACPDVTIGAPWDGSYRVQRLGEHTWHGGVPRDQLQVLEPEELTVPAGPERKPDGRGTPARGR